MLGEGSFGTVYSARHLSAAAEAQALAVKVVATGGLTEHARRQVRREVVLHSQLRNTHIAELLGVYSGGSGHVHLVMRAYVGSLAMLLDQPAKSLQSLVPRLMADVLAALRYLHDEQQAQNQPQYSDSYRLSLLVSLAAPWQIL